MARKKEPNPIDKYVGARVRMRRMMLSMSQEKLADGLDLTFQQVQKYEKGTNRIGASRLQQISTILKVPVSFFFEGAPGMGGKEAQNWPSDPATKFFSTFGGAELAENFIKIEDNEARRAVIVVARALARP